MFYTYHIRNVLCVNPEKVRMNVIPLLYGPMRYQQITQEKKNNFLNESLSGVILSHRPQRERKADETFNISLLLNLLSIQQFFFVFFCCLFL